ncbi:MAG TPA: hypothetical protein PL110_18815 [Candidatus Eremiobacteraeota bacterium]|nr:hypothetical protein [Candidatus Eremiobacteraeota bacterium]
MKYINADNVCQFCDLVSVGTACGPAVKWVRERLSDWPVYMVEDGFIMSFYTGNINEYHKESEKGVLVPSLAPEILKNIKILYVAHLDEIGGIVMLPESTGFRTRIIGNIPQVFANRPLLAMDYLDKDGSTVRPCRGWINKDELFVEGENFEPLRTVFTFNEKTTVQDGWINGKALDPRLTAYAVIEAAYYMKRPDVAVMLVFAEECSIYAAKKGSCFAHDMFPSLSLVVNCDVPGLKNIEGGKLDQCIMRLYEGRTFIDPSFGIPIYDELIKHGCRLTMASTLTGSQTFLFIPQCHTISLGIAEEEAHAARTRASLSALEDLIEVLITIPDVVIPIIHQVY